MKDLVNVAVIGAGYWGKKVISEYLQLSKLDPKVNLLMVCDLNSENLRFCNKAFHIDDKKLTTNYEKVLGSNEVDAIHICTPNETHYPIGKEALSADKHVLLEKPMALYARHAWELVGIAESKSLILQVGHIFRFNNAVKIIRDLIRQYYFGDLYYLKLQWTTFMSQPLNRDIIFDLGPHPIDIVNFLLNKWPDQVSCKAKAYRHELLKEVAYITLEFGRKLLAHIELSWLQPQKVRQITLVGSEKCATVDCLNQSILINENNNGNCFNLDVPVNNTILDEVRHFVESILKGKNSHNTGFIGSMNVAILQNLKKSLEKGKTEKPMWE